MKGPDTGDEAHAARIAEATDWFARMRGPDADDAKATFDVWLADPENARVYFEIEQVWGVTGQSSVGAGPPLQTRPVWTRYAMAAALAIVAIGLALLLSGYGASSWRPPTGAMLTYASQIGEIRTITLPDGSTVTLDTASRFDVAYSGVERRVDLLAGRARFSVAHDASRRFVVSVQGKDVIAHGTVFDVRIDRDVFEVTLFEGAVDIERHLDTALQRVARLTPGQRMTLGDDQAAPVMSTADNGEAQWTSGLLTANGTPLAQVIAEANRYSRQKIVLADSSLGNLRVAGAFRPRDAEALATKLSAALELSSAVRPDGTVVIARIPF